MIALVAIPVVIAAVAYRHIQLYAPANILIGSVQVFTPRWRTAGLLIALFTVVLVLMHTLARAVADGAPGWLNLLVLVLAWDCFKFGFAACGVAARCIRRACSHR
jgi:hypothetical protein